MDGVRRWVLAVLGMLLAVGVGVLLLSRQQSGPPPLTDEMLAHVNDPGYKDWESGPDWVVDEDATADAAEEAARLVALIEELHPQEMVLGLSLARLSGGRPKFTEKPWWIVYASGMTPFCADAATSEDDSCNPPPRDGYHLVEAGTLDVHSTIPFFLPEDAS